MYEVAASRRKMREAGASRRTMREAGASRRVMREAGASRETPASVSASAGESRRVLLLGQLATSAPSSSVFSMATGSAAGLPSGRPA